MKNRLMDVHRFWFGESRNDLEILQHKSKIWFAKDDALDAEIRRRFADLVEQAALNRFDFPLLAPLEQLAVILLLDQFSRNIFRDDPRSFAADPLARSHAQSLLNNEAADLNRVEKVFLYLPFEHAESLDDQKKSVALFHQLHQTAPAELRQHTDGFLDYAVRHFEIIERFGRFPHRNKILGRASTPEELDFLAQPGSSF
jgi:uncharacterized protein (DUF924 family)